MAKVYDQFDAAFRHVNAYAILKDGKPVARVCLKHGGAVTAYVHWIGIEMARGTAGGGGYDRGTAAVENAQRKIMVPVDATPEQRARWNDNRDLAAFLEALSHDDGAGWIYHLERAGFVVVNVIA